MTDRDRGLLENALSSAIDAVRYAFDQKWEGGHLLAHARKPVAAFFSTNPEEQKWWTDKLAKFADRLARLPIVECTSRFLPAIVPDSSEEAESEDTNSENWYADFVIPRLSPTSPEADTSIDKMWPLVEAAIGLLPPRKELATDWTEISKGWAELGLELGLVYVSNLAEYVREDAEMLSELQVTGDPREWLAKFLDLVGECWSKRGMDSSVLTNILPNQNHRLCSPATLNRDSGVSDELKNICADIGIDIRERLFLDAFDDISAVTELPFLSEAIAKAVPVTVSEGQVIEDTIKHLQFKFPEDEDCRDESVNLQKASVRLLWYIWESHGTAGALGRPKMASEARF